MPQTNHVLVNELSKDGDLVQRARPDDIASPICSPDGEAGLESFCLVKAPDLSETVGLILRLHWRACLDGAILPGGPPPISFDRSDVQRLGRHRLVRMFFGPDQTSRFWLRERAYVALLSVLALHSRWLAEQPRPLSSSTLAAHSGLSERMVRLTLNQGVETGDIAKGVVGANRRQRYYDLTPRLIHTLQRLEDERIALMAQGIGRRNPCLPEPALLALYRLRFAMMLTASGPSGTPGETEINRRVPCFLMFDLLLDGPQRLRDLVPRAAERLGVSTVTIRTTLRRAATLGWVEGDNVIAATALTRDRFGRAGAAFLLRWHLVFNVMEALEKRPHQAEGLVLDLWRATDLEPSIG